MKELRRKVFQKGRYKPTAVIACQTFKVALLLFFLIFRVPRNAELDSRAANVTSRARREKSRTRASDKAVLIEGRKQTPTGERARFSRKEHTKHRDKRNAAAAHGQGRGAPAAKIRTPTHVHVVSMRARSGQTTPPFQRPKAGSGALLLIASSRGKRSRNVTRCALLGGAWHNIHRTEGRSRSKLPEK